MTSLGRREFLLGAGGSMMALPWLELNADTGNHQAAPLRFASFYSPMGFVRDHFFPGKDKSDFLSMPTLRPLQSVGSKVNLICDAFLTTLEKRLDTNLHNLVTSWQDSSFLIQPLLRTR